MTQKEINTLIYNDWKQLFETARVNLLEWLNTQEDIYFDNKELKEIKFIIWESMKTGDPIVSKMSAATLSSFVKAFNMMRQLRDNGELHLPLKMEMYNMIAGSFDIIYKVLEFELLEKV